MPDYITICEEAARTGGRVLMEWQGRFNVREKGTNDLVTEADLASQDAIRRVVLDAFPQHEFLGEEETSGNGDWSDHNASLTDASQFRWLVDPLDGTTNYVHHLQNFAVSVALEDRGRVLVGTVYDPTTEECYTAQLGQGAYLNGRRLSTSSCTRLKDALVAVSFSANVPRGSEEVKHFVEVLHSAQSLRRLGSASLNLCYLADGRLDAYWSTSVKAWDVAAGILLIREAGGTVSAMDGTRLNLYRPRLAAAATLALHKELVATLARVG